MFYIMRKLIGILLLCAVVWGVAGVAYAADSTDEVGETSYVDGDADNPSESAIDFSQLSETQKPFNRARRDQFPASHLIDVPLCTQETRYYCGPATVQQVMKLNMGTTFTATQDEIADDIGTTSAGSDLDPMVEYISNKTDIGYRGYTIAYMPSIDDMQYMIGSTTFFFHGAPIARIVFDREGSWPYSSGGHFLNVSGYDYGNMSNPESSSNEVRLTDPFIKWIDPTSNGTYWVELNELHTATMDSYSKEFAY